MNVNIYIKAHCGCRTWIQNFSRQPLTWRFDVFQGVIPFPQECCHIYHNAFLRWELWALLKFMQQQNFVKTAVTCQGFVCNLIRPSISKVRSNKLIFLWSLDTVERFWVKLEAKYEFLMTFNSSWSHYFDSIYLTWETSCQQK